MADIPKAKKYTKHHRNAILRIALRVAALVVAVVGLVILYLALFTKAFSPLSSVSKMDVPVSAKVTATSDRLYYFSGSTLTAVDRSGKTAWQSKFQGTDLKVAASDMLLCVYDESMATVLDTFENILYTIPSTEYTFREAVCGNGSVALLCSLPDSAEVTYVRVFDLSGSEIYRFTNEKTNILNFGLTGVNDNLWMLTLDTSGVDPISRIALCSPAQNALTGTVEITDQLVSDIYFFDTDMYVSGTNNLAQYDTFGNKGSSTLVYGLKCIDAAYSGKNYTMLYIPRSVQDVSNVLSMRVLAKNDTGETDSFLQMPRDAVAIHASMDHVFCFMKDSVRIYALSGEFQEEKPLGFTLKSTKKITSDEVLLYSEDTVYLMKLN